MACPFGFKSSDAQGESEDEQDQRKEDVQDKHKAPKQAGKEDVSWFYRNQIKADKEALARKRKKNEEAKAKLEAIMATKHKQLEFADGLEDMSIASSELSELDSDVHSMAGLKSCAESWIEDAGYKAPAEQWVKNSAVTVLAASGFAAFQAYGMYTAAGIDPAHTINTQWAVAGMCCTGALAACVALLYYCASKRSKRLLLVNGVLLLGVYSCTAALMAYAYAHPTMIEPKYLDAHCPHSTHRSTAGKNPNHSTACRAVNAANKELGDAAPWFLTGLMVTSLTTLFLLTLSLWYLFELAFIEKKAAKHMKRHRHHRHRIPWHKIKVVGPVMSCGAGGPKPVNGKGGAKTGGKCPVMH